MQLGCAISPLRRCAETIFRRRRQEVIMETESTLLITRSEVAALLGLAECIGAVEEAFRLHAEGMSLPPGVLETLTGDGGFHIKAAGLRLPGGSYYAAKVNANFPLNPERFGLPTKIGR